MPENSVTHNSKYNIRSWANSLINVMTIMELSNYTVSRNVCSIYFPIFSSYNSPSQKF